MVEAISIGPFATPLAAQNAAAVPYENMPEIAPPGVRIGKHIDVPEQAKGPAVDPAKGYRLQRLGRNLYMVTDNAYQSMFLIYEGGVVVVDAPPSYAALIPKAIAQVTDRPITHLVYSHEHKDHIGGAAGLGGQAVRHRRVPPGNRSPPNRSQNVCASSGLPKQNATKSKSFRRKKYVSGAADKLAATLCTSSLFLRSPFVLAARHDAANCA